MLLEFMKALVSDSGDGIDIVPGAETVAFLLSLHNRIG